MLHHALLVTHIIVLGYWLGADLVINATFRHVCYARDMPFKERDRLLDHIMKSDQHVRYALALQVGLGLTLASLTGYLPGGDITLWLGVVIAGALLLLIEIAHRSRKTETGLAVARTERLFRYILAISFVLTGLLALFGQLATPAWLGVKLILFAGVITCGVLIRLILVSFGVTWREISETGNSPELEVVVRELYGRSTRVLIVLWSCIAAIVLLSVLKPL